MLSLQELKEVLKTNVVEITFTKQNGEVRVIDACTNPDLTAPISGSGRKGEVNEELLIVTDVKIDEWRSFNYSQITNIKVLETVEECIGEDN